MRYEFVFIDRARMPKARKRRSSHRMARRGVFRENRGEGGRARPGRVTITIDFDGDGPNSVKIEVD